MQNESGRKAMRITVKENNSNTGTSGSQNGNNNNTGTSGSQNGNNSNIGLSLIHI